MSGALEYVEGASVLHRMNPVTKLAIAVAVGVAAFATDSIALLLGLLVLDVALGLASRNAKGTLSLLRGLGSVSILLFVLQAALVRTGEPTVLFATDEGLLLGARVALRLIDATLPLALVLEVTRFSDLNNALVSVVRVPYEYAFTITTAIRFIPVLMTEMNSILDAQAARGVETDTGNIIKKLRLIVPLCVPLLIGAVKRGETTAVAAELRGFHLRGRDSSYRDYPIRALDGVTLLGCVALALAGIIL